MISGQAERAAATRPLLPGQVIFFVLAGTPALQSVIGPAARPGPVHRNPAPARPRRNEPAPGAWSRSRGCPGIDSGGWTGSALPPSPPPSHRASRPSTPVPALTRALKDRARKGSHEIIVAEETAFHHRAVSRSLQRHMWQSAGRVAPPADATPRHATPESAGRELQYCGVPSFVTLGDRRKVVVSHGVPWD